MNTINRIEMNEDDIKSFNDDNINKLFINDDDLELISIEINDHIFSIDRESNYYIHDELINKDKFYNLLELNQF